MARDDAHAETHPENGPHARLTLLETAFEELAAGGGSPPVIRQLWQGQWSRRLIVLRAFYELAVGDPELSGPLPPLADAWSALEHAQQAAPDEVAGLLMHPQVGSWLSYAVRRHRGGAESDAPLHIDFGQLHALALSGAALAGQSYTTRVPMRAGRVMVPQFGMAAFTGCEQWDVAEAGTENGRIWLRYGDHRIDVPTDGDGDGWWALRQVTAGDELRLTVWLDDLDPMRDLADPVPPKRQTDSEVERWSELLRGAWEILVADHRELAEALAVGVTSLVPLPVGDGWDTRSASTGDAFGAIMCSPPPDAITLAVSLAHEFMHIKLGGLMHLVPLTNGPGRPRHYAPWRDDPRPAGGLLQGVYAFAGIAMFWRAQLRQHGASRSAVMPFEYAYSRDQAIEAIGIIRESGALTPQGLRFTELLAAVLADWDDEIGAEAAALADLVAAGHRAGWRIRHCRPQPQDVEALCKAWANGSEEPFRAAASVVHPDPEMRHWSQGRLGLARRVTVAPGRAVGALDEEWGSALSVADVALFQGDGARAKDGFLKQLEQDPESVDSWTGLGLALGAGEFKQAREVLLARPELVLAVYREVGANPFAPASPIDVAAWVGRVVSA